MYWASIVREAGERNLGSASLVGSVRSTGKGTAMELEREGGRFGGVRLKTVRGASLHVADRKLTPMARVLSWGRARGTFGSKQLSGWAGAFASITPVAVIIEDGDGEQRLSINDTTLRALWGISGAGLALTLFLVALRWSVRRLHRSQG